MDLKLEKRSESGSTATKVSSNCPGSDSGSGSSSGSKQIKSCSDFQTTRTLLWRGGPAGPKSLCNVCGIKYNKKRRNLLGLDKGKKKRKISGGSGGGVGGRSNSSGREGIGQSFKMKLMGFDEEIHLEREIRKLLSTLREEEQAAVLLMALSCGSVYA